MKNLRKDGAYYWVYAVGGAQHPRRRDRRVHLGAPQAVALEGGRGRRAVRDAAMTDRHAAATVAHVHGQPRLQRASPARAGTWSTPWLQRHTGDADPSADLRRLRGAAPGARRAAASISSMPTRSTPPGSSATTATSRSPARTRRPDEAVVAVNAEQRGRTRWSSLRAGHSHRQHRQPRRAHDGHDHDRAGRPRPGQRADQPLPELRARRQGPALRRGRHRLLPRRDLRRAVRRPSAISCECWCAARSSSSVTCSWCTRGWRIAPTPSAPQPAADGRRGRRVLPRSTTSASNAGTPWSRKRSSS